MKIQPQYLDYAKSGLFMAFGSITDDNGAKMRLEVGDDQLTAAAEIALDYLANVVFGTDVRMKFERKDAA